MVRKAVKTDLKDILDIYESARIYMKNNGNPNQWGDEWPPVHIVEEDINNETLYVIERNDTLCGVMEFHIGEDPSYGILDEGKWHYDSEYATVHRIASNGEEAGIFKEFLDFGKTICKHIRIDTHTDNIIMQTLIEKHEFEKCGRFFSQSKRWWVAYEKIFD